MDFDRDVEALRTNWSEAPYYALAERDMDWQWTQLIAPWLEGLDLTRVLELAPGHGRNTKRLLKRAREIHLVDVNATCIDACRARFADHVGPCRLHYHVNDGSSLSLIADTSVTFVYSWDAMVHFDARVIERYLAEFARILEPGGHGFVHHSNYAALEAGRDSSWLDNPHWRSAMSRERFAALCEAAGLRVVRQQTIEWGAMPDLDCITLLQRPAASG
jgi:ubiquinone/menaquinone biosynthesis C-methylase UbiE